MDGEEESGLYWSLWWLASFRWVSNVVRILWITVNNFYVIPAYFAWLLLCSPLYFVNASLWWHIEDVLFGWLLSFVACWNYTAGYHVVESGERLDSIRKENLLFMPNHQSTADVPLCMTLFTARPNFADRVMWIMDKVFKYSNFGCVSWMHDDFFILAGKENREASIVDLRNHLHKVFLKKKRKYIVLFPEGGFLRKRKPISQSFAKKNDLPNLDYCTLPRTGALEAILEVLGPEAVASNGATASAASNSNSINNGQLTRSGHLTKIVDVTIAYPNGEPLDIFQIAAASRPPCTTHVHYRTFDIKDLPRDPEAVKHWMYNLYAEKDRMLETYYSTGRFPYDMYPTASTSTSGSGNDSSHTTTSFRRPRDLHHDPMKFLFLHLFFLASTIVFGYVGYFVYSTVSGIWT